jgi:carboxypeptidase Taq
MGLYGTIHEGGHGLYELGIPLEMRNTALGDCASLAIHESQSRFWENIIGRSRAFFKTYFAKIKELFPENLDSIDDEKMYRAVNKVEPSFIRVEADEVTYSLHIILRFRIEKMIMEGKVKVQDLPELWRSLSKELFGIVPEKVSLGVLQDVHWSIGAIGYFPTYALGNLYSAQFMHYMQKDLDVYKLVEQKNLLPILEWLRKKIHSQGALYSGPELCQNVTGEKLNAGYFVDYLNNKFSNIYNF